jgi:hypothetical protein
MTSAERLATEDMKSPAMSVLVRAVAGEVASLLRVEFARLTPSDVHPALLNVKQAAVYLGRTEQSVQHSSSNEIFRLCDSDIGFTCIAQTLTRG